MPILTRIQISIKPARRQQRIVRAAFNETAVFNHKKLVGAADCAEAVGDDEGETAVLTAQCV